MPEHQIEMAVVGFAKSRAIKIARLGKDLENVSKIVEINSRTINKLEGSIDLTIRTLDRFEKNNKIENLTFVGIVYKQISEWNEIAKEYDFHAFCLELDGLQHFLNAIIHKDENPNLLLDIYKNIIQPVEERLTAENISRALMESKKYSAGSGDIIDKENKEKIAREILIHNEKTKITATAFGTTATGLYGGGVVLPVVAATYPLPAAPALNSHTATAAAAWALVAVGLHWVARAMLGKLR